MKTKARRRRDRPTEAEAHAAADRIAERYRGRDTSRLVAFVESRETIEPRGVRVVTPTDREDEV